MACQLVVRSVELLRGQHAASKGLCHDQLCVVRRRVNPMRRALSSELLGVQAQPGLCRLGRSQACALQL